MAVYQPIPELNKLPPLPPTVQPDMSAIGPGQDTGYGTPYNPAPPLPQPTNPLSDIGQGIGNFLGIPRDIGQGFIKGMGTSLGNIGASRFLGTPQFPGYAQTPPAQTPAEAVGQFLPGLLGFGQQPQEASDLASQPFWQQALNATLPMTTAHGVLPTSQEVGAIAGMGARKTAQVAGQGLAKAGKVTVPTAKELATSERGAIALPFRPSTEATQAAKEPWQMTRQEVQTYSKTSRESLKRDLETILSEPHTGTIGLRVPTTPDFTGAKYAVGDTLPSSYNWKEGVPTNKKLNGTSVIQVDKNNIDRALQLIGDYPNARDVLIVRGQKTALGTDPGEIFLKDPRVLSVHPFAAVEKIHMHDFQVGEALRQGKPVPPEVLADHPHLQAKYGEATPPNAPTAEIPPSGTVPPIEPPKPPITQATPPPPQPSVPTTGRPIDRMVQQAKETVRQDKPGVITNALNRIPLVGRAVRFERPGLKMQGENANILTGHIAENSARAEVSTRAFSTRIPLLSDLSNAFGKDALRGGKTDVPFLGTAEQAKNPITGTIKDIADNPELYQLNEAQKAALSNMDKRNTQLLGYVTDGYGAEIGQYNAKPGGAFLPNVEPKNLTEGIVRETRPAASGRSKTRFYPSARDRMASDPTFKPELNVQTLLEGIDTSKSQAAGGMTLREAVGGKTRLEAMQETHPALYKKMMGLRGRLQSLQSSAGTIDENLHNAVNDFLKSPVEGTDLSALQSALDVKLKSGPRVGMSAAEVQKQVDGIRAQIKALKPSWNVANLKPYKFIQEGLYRYLPEQQAALFAESRKISNNPLLNLIESWRGQAFSGDFSPFAIQDAVGILADPPGSISAIAGGVKKSVQSGDLLRGVKPSALAEDVAKDPQGWADFAAYSGRQVSGTPAEFSAGFLTKIPKFAQFSEGTYVTVTRSAKALYDRTWQDFVKGGMDEVQAKVAAATTAGQIYPMVNPARLGQSQARAAVIRALPTSYSFIRQPATIMANAAKGYVKLGLKQTLSPVEKTSVKLMTTLAASVMTASATSAAVSAISEGKDPVQAALDAINPDPHNGKFASLVFGSHRIPLGGPYRAIFRAIYPQDVKGVPFPLPFAGLPSYVSNRVTPAAKAQLALLQNKDYYGNKIMWGTFPEQLLRGLAYEMETALPLTAGAGVEGVRTGATPQDTAAQMAGQFAGVNVMENKPTPAFVKANSLKDNLASQSYGAKWDELGPTQQLTLLKQSKDLQQLDQQSTLEKKSPGVFDPSAQIQAGRDAVSKTAPVLSSEIKRLNIYPQLDRTLNIPATGTDFYLNDSRFKTYQELTAILLDKYLIPKINTPVYQKAPDTQKQEALKGWISEIKSAAGLSMLKSIDKTTQQQPVGAR